MLKQSKLARTHTYTPDQCHCRMEANFLVLTQNFNATASAINVQNSKSVSLTLGQQQYLYNENKLE